MTNVEHQQDTVSYTSIDKDSSHDASTTVKTERLGNVFFVTISRPKVRNAIDGPTAASLTRAFHLFEADDTLAIAVLTDTGNTFCSGADLSAISEGQRSLHVAENGDAPLGVSRMLLSKPVIAAVEGYAVAGGLELAL